MSENFLENTLYFQVSDFTPTLSDCHCRLSFGMLASYFVDTSQNDNINRSIFPGRYIWSASIGQQICDTLTQADAKCNIKKFLNNEFTLTSEGIEKAFYECHEIIENAVKKTAVLKKPEKKRKPKNKNFFDSDLGKKREILISKGKLLTKFPFDPLVRGSYFKCYREYNKVRKHKKTTVQTKRLGQSR